MYKRKMILNITTVFILLTVCFFPLISTNVNADSITGWAVFTNNGKVYRCSVEGNPEQLYDGNAAHACWSADGAYIYFIKSNGDIWVMDNDGSNPTELNTDTNNMAKCPIGPYRPNANYVLYVENDKFYKISRSSGVKTLIHDDTRTYDGEIAISTDGTRMAGRDGDDICKIEVGGSTTVYAPRCSSSISPNGEYLTKNWPGHTQMSIYTWDVYYPNTPYKDLYTPSGLNWDNQKFVANSDDYVVYKIDSGATAIGLVRISDATHWQIGNKNSDHPDFFLGSLPNSGPSAPTITTSPVTNTNVGLLYQYNVDATGNPNPSYSLDTHPTGMTIDTLSGLIQWTPSSSGDYNVKVNATNGNGYDAQSFVITVSAGGSSCSAGINSIVDATATGDAGTLLTVSLCGNSYVVVDDLINGNTNRYDSSDQVVNPSPYYSQYADNFSFADCTTLDSGTGASYLETIFSEHVYTFVIFENGGTSDEGDIQCIDSSGNLVGSPTHFSASDYYDTGYISGILSQPVKGFAYTASEPVKGIRISDATGLDPIIIAAVVESTTTAPSIISTPQTTAPIFELFNYDVDATGTPTPTYELTQWPSEMTIDENTGLITWTPDTVGDFDVTVVASNGVAPDDIQTFTITVFDQSPSCPDGMIHYWKLDENSGSPYIDSYGDADLTCSNCPTTSSGKVDNAQDFNAANTERIYTDPISNPTSEITVMAWVKPDDLTSPDKGIITKENTFLLEIESEGAELSFSRYQGGSFSECEPEVSVFHEGVWTHVAATWDGSVSRVYVNGSEIGSDDFADGPINSNTNPYYVGFSTYDPDRYFDGCIDEVAVFDTALEETEIQQLYNKGLTGEGYCEPQVSSAPSITSTPVTSATAGVLYSYNVDATGNPIPTYSLELHPTGMTINMNSGLIEWIPASTGSFDVIVNATNSEGWDIQSFTINVIQQSGPGCPQNMIGYWKLNELSSGSYEDSVCNNDGICPGTCPSPLSDGKINGGQSFQRSLQTGIDIPVNDSFNWGAGDSFTMEFWMKRDGPIGGTQTNDNEVIMGRDDSSTNLHWWFGIEHDSGAARFQIGDKGGDYVSIEGPAVDDNIWHHLVGIRDGDNNKNILYVDGKEVANVTMTYSNGFDSTTAPINIGWLNLPGYFYYTGHLDDVALYNRVLSEKEIRMHYYLARSYCEICDTKINIMPLGDSITYDNHAGDTRPEGLRTGYRQPLWILLNDSGYNVDFVGDIIAGQDAIPDFDPDNEGHPGWRDDQIADNIYSFLQNNPADVILLHIGTNGLNSDPGDVEDILDEIDRYESDYDMDITVILARIINRISYSSTTTDFNDNVEAMALDRVENSGNPAYPDKIVFVDMENGAEIIYTQDTTEPYNDGDMYDNLHPNDLGYSKMADLWYSTLQSFMPICQLNPSSPLITSTPNTDATVGHTYSYDVESNGFPTPVYSLDSNPVGMTINTNTGLINWVPSSTGTYDVIVNASNSEGFDTQSFTINVAEAPLCPAEMTHYWKLDDAGSPYEDSIGDNDATCTNCPTATTGIVNGAQDFDGSSDEVDVSDDGTFDWGVDDSFSIEYWMNTTTCAGNKVTVGRDDGSLHWWTGGHGDTHSAGFQLRDSTRAGIFIAGTTAVDDGQWHHVVCVRNGSSDTNRIYIDGTEENSDTYDYAHDFASSTELNIGYITCGGHYNFDGKIDEVALYDKALTPSEVEQHYNNGLNGLGYCDGITKPGDANGDGNVNVLDLTYIENIILLIYDSTPGADANGDGNVNVLDLTATESIILGL